jgi:short-subunit dehydrogenase
MNLVITGATKGIGKAIVQKFAREGFNIAMAARTKADLKAVKKELLQLNPTIEVLIQEVDIQSKEQVEKFTKKIIKKWGEIDILVNNAGAFIQNSILEEPDGFLENMMSTNLYGAYYLTRSLLPTLIKQQKGHIFNMCSVASTKVYPNCSSYVISKFALLGFTKVLRQELIDKNIKVTALMPGATWSNSWNGVELPLERLMPPEAVADAIWGAFNMSKNATVEELVMRPQLGDL